MRKVSGEYERDIPVDCQRGCRLLVLFFTTWVERVCAPVAVTNIVTLSPDNVIIARSPLYPTITWPTINDICRVSSLNIVISTSTQHTIRAIAGIDEICRATS